MRRVLPLVIAMLMLGSSVGAIQAHANCVDQGPESEETTATPDADKWGNPSTLQDHYNRHGPDFGATSPTDYAAKAQAFLQRAYQDWTIQIKEACQGGPIRIYDSMTNTFGAYNQDGTTRTFFKPDPVLSGHPTGQDYFDYQHGYLTRTEAPC